MIRKRQRTLLWSTTFSGPDRYKPRQCQVCHNLIATQKSQTLAMNDGFARHPAPAIFWRETHFIARPKNSECTGTLVIKEEFFRSCSARSGAMSLCHLGVPPGPGKQSPRFTKRDLLLSDQ